MNRELIRLTETVADYIGDANDAGSRGFEFNRLALEIFDFQYRSIEPYRRLCQRKGKTPETVEDWSEIPAVPADAFKHFFLFVGEPGEVVKVFRSSGTTDSRRSSNAHFSSMGLQLMKTAIETNAARMLFPDGRRTRMLILAPSPDLAPGMIMAYGMSKMMELFGLEGSRFCVGAQGLDVNSVLTELRQCEEQGIPVTAMGSSFGFVQLFDRMEETGLRLALPEGSRLMDAGGYKGRSRELRREEFVHWACSMLGLPEERIVNLLGMTELASQIYDNVLADHNRKTAPAGVSSPTRAKVSPPWVRTRVLDPTSMIGGDFKRITEINRLGLLRHLDLANVERPMVIQTDDLGLLSAGFSQRANEQAEGAGFEIIQRVKGAEPRGCSLSVEDFASIAPPAGRRE